MAPKITSARNRNKRSASRKPTSSKNRPQRSRASTNSNNITSDRLRKALQDIDRRPTQGRGVERTNRVSRATRGPARAPVQGPSTPPIQGPSRPTSSGLIGSRAPTTPPPPSPPTPRFTDGSARLTINNTVSPANRIAKLGQAAATLNAYALTAQIVADDVMNRGLADGTLEGQPVSEQQGPPAPKPKAKSKRVVKAPPKKNQAVLAKNNGVTGSLVNGVFVAHPWSAEQTLRYGIRGGQ